MWHTEMIGEVPVHWFLMSRGPEDIYGIAAQEGTMYCGKIYKSMLGRIHANLHQAKPPKFKLDDTEDKKTVVKKTFTEWSK